MRNLSLLIQQILKQFDIARKELELSQQQISQETVSALTEVLSLESIDQSMLDDLADFLYKISKQRAQNFQLISDFCREKSGTLIDKLNTQLQDIFWKFQELKLKLTPNKSDRELSQNSAYEEEKGQHESPMVIDTMERQLSTTKVPLIKLGEEDEKKLKQLLKV